MNRRTLAISALACLALAAGCPSGEDDASNPPRLWLYLDGRETEVKLVDYEPPPF